MRVHTKRFENSLACSEKCDDYFMMYEPTRSIYGLEKLQWLATCSVPNQRPIYLLTTTWYLVPSFCRVFLLHPGPLRSGQSKGILEEFIVIGFRRFHWGCYNTIATVELPNNMTTF